MCNNRWQITLIHSTDKYRIIRALNFAISDMTIVPKLIKDFITKIYKPTTKIYHENGRRKNGLEWKNCHRHN